MRASCMCVASYLSSPAVRISFCHSLQSSLVFSRTLFLETFYKGRDVAGRLCISCGTRSPLPRWWWPRCSYPMVVASFSPSPMVVCTVNAHSYLFALSIFVTFCSELSHQSVCVFRRSPLFSDRGSRCAFSRRAPFVHQYMWCPVQSMLICSVEIFEVLPSRLVFVVLRRVPCELAIVGALSMSLQMPHARRSRIV